MHDQPHARTVRVQTRPDGVLLYLVALSPEALPPVRARDLTAAWDAARTAALDARWGAARLFRFHRADGSTLDLALGDPDACCWADAVDGTVGMTGTYGLSLCLRLLGLVDLLGRTPWANGLMALRRDGAALAPALTQAAATGRLTSEGRFDESDVRRRCTALPCLAAAVPA